MPKAVKLKSVSQCVWSPVRTDSHFESNTIPRTQTPLLAVAIRSHQTQALIQKILQSLSRSDLLCSYDVKETPFGAMALFQTAMDLQWCPECIRLRIKAVEWTEASWFGQTFWLYMAFKPLSQGGFTTTGLHFAQHVDKKMYLSVNTSSKTPYHLHTPEVQSLGEHDNAVQLQKVSSPQFQILFPL